MWRKRPSGPARRRELIGALVVVTMGALMAVDGVRTWVDARVRTPGFGGGAALAAACVALWGVRLSRRAEDSRARESRWWDQARWGCEMALRDSDVAIAFGVAALMHVIEDGDVDELEARAFAAEALDGLASDSSGRPPDAGDILERHNGGPHAT